MQLQVKELTSPMACCITSDKASYRKSPLQMSFQLLTGHLNSHRHLHGDGVRQRRRVVRLHRQARKGIVVSLAIVPVLARIS